MEIDFNSIRPLGGDRRLGFEELCCQLAEIDTEEEMGQSFVRSSFYRKEGKGGDSGVECFYVLSDGSEWGWQAKYFIDVLGQSQWKQIDESVKKALAGHPRLRRYTICLPVNLTDSRDAKKKSQMDHWREHEAKWIKWSREADQRIDFVLWGESRLRKRLLDLGDRGAGYILYWFDEKILTAEWFLSRFEEAKKGAGPRYTPELHVDLPLCSKFDAFCRTDSFVETIAGSYSRLLRKWKAAEQWSDIPGAEERTEAARRLGREVHRLALALEQARKESFEEIDFDEVFGLVSTAMEQNSHFIDLFEQPGRQEQDGQGFSRHSESALTHYLYELQSALGDIANFTHSPEARLTNKRVTLLSGEAGTGKTHLFCDLAKKRIEEGLATVLLLGQNFSPGETPWSQVVKELDLGQMEADKFLGALDTAARARGKRALILIDALNEGVGAEFWNDRLAGMVARLNNYPRVVLAVSCRESYVDDLIPEDFMKSDEIYRLRHHGFQGHEIDATRTFFSHYGIRSPSEPLLVPEFSNPLFLKLLCQGLANERKRKVPKGLKGVTKLFQFFIDSVNRKISKRLGIDPKDEIVSRVVDALAQRMADSEENWLERNEAKAIIDGVRPEPPEYERTLFRNLVHEGVLREDRYRLARGQRGIDGVSFAYERLADHLVVSRWLRHAVNLKKPKAILEALPVVRSMAQDERFANVHAGWVEALSIQLPELLGKELVHLAVVFKNWSVFRDAFLSSLLWRDASKVGTETIRFVNELLRSCSNEEFDTAMEVFLMVACDVDHRLNARSLHQWLSSFTMGERDYVWSIFLHDQYEYKEEGPVHRLIDWAWNSDKSEADDDVIELCSIVLTWFLTSSHRFLRDRATKALLSMLQERPRVILKLVAHFQDVDDPYVAERLCAVAYGVAMSADDDDALPKLAEKVYKSFFVDGSPPPHILLRDYARGVIEVAAQRGFLPSPVNQALVTPPYSSRWPLEIPLEEELPGAAEPTDVPRTQRLSFDRLYGWIVGRAHPHSDWVIYKLSPACTKFKPLPPELLGPEEQCHQSSDETQVIRNRFDTRLAQRWVMKRVVDLGWTAERFGEFDSRIKLSTFYRRTDTSKPERISKKYAWIAMHELLGYLSDHLDYCGTTWRNEPDVYRGPWQMLLRDIDPTQLSKRRMRTSHAKTVRSWWQPVEYQFVPQGFEDHEHWVQDCSNVFDPLDLLDIQDPHGKDWLTLQVFSDWTEEVPLGEDPHDCPRRYVWLMIKSYIVKSRNAAALIRWLDGQSLWGRWMPESQQMYDVFLGEYPWAPAFTSDEESQAWTKGYRRNLPHPVVVTATEYLQERGYDCSIDETISALLPSPWLVRSMGLSWSRKGFSFIDGNGRVVAFDPSEGESRPSILLASKDALTDFLGAMKCDLVWTFLGEQQVLPPAFRSSHWDYIGHTILQATYRLRNGRVMGGPLKAEFQR